MQTLRWGILGTGNVANSMAQALHDSEDANIVAVASRTQERADAFGRKWEIARCYGAYERLAADPDIDVIYIATPHSEHYRDMLLGLNAHKHILCEKAFALNAAQAAECIALARRNKLFLMEAMWMRFFPAMTRVRTWLQQGVIGDIRLVQADFCVKLPADPEHRLNNLTLGGGALLDLGIYPLSFAAMVLGVPRQIQSYAQIGPAGVDELDTVICAYEHGASAALTCGMRVYKPREAFIVGTQGYIKVQNIFFRPDSLTLHRNGKDLEVVNVPFDGNGYIHEIEEVQTCVRTGKTESEIMPLDETLSLLQLMDELRATWGVVYPGESLSQRKDL